MKKYIIILLLIAGISQHSVSFAQEPLDHKKEMKMDKKSAKAMRDDQKHNTRKGNKKDEKALKKSGRIEKQEEKGKFDK